MSLTLEDVKNVRFPIAKRVGEGYRAAEVDDFVDRVDATFGSMIEEKERLKAQLEALDGKAAAPVADPKATARQDELVAENERLKGELEKARQSASAPVVAHQGDSDEVKRLRSENEQLRQQTAELRQQVEASRQATPLTVMDGQSGEGRIEKIVVSTAAQASPAVTRLVQLATEQAEAVVAETKVAAEHTVKEAEAKAKNLTVDATTRAERIESAARVEADRLNQQARANSDAVNADAEKRRQEMFSALEAERDQLIGRVGGLRSFEGSYRDNLVKHFEAQLDAVKKISAEPVEKPELLNGSQAVSSSTPRLDALLAEGRKAN